MKTHTKLVATALLVAALGIPGIGAASAQSAASASPEAIEPLCDYCADYTDAATATSTVRSAYRPGTGYAAIDRQAEGETSWLQKMARLHLLKKPSQDR